MSCLANIRDDHWELVARCWKTGKFCTKGVSRERYIHVNIGACCRDDECEMCVTRIHGEMEGDTWRFLGIGWAEEELVSFQFSFDSLTEYRFREKLQR